MVLIPYLELFEGDIVLDRKTADIVSGNNRFDAVKSDTRKWPKAVVPYIFASNFGEPLLKLSLLGYERCRQKTLLLSLETYFHIDHNPSSVCKQAIIL